MAPRSTHRLVTLTTAALALSLLAGCGAVADTDTEKADAPAATPTPGPEKSRTSTPTPDAVASPSATERSADQQPTRSASTRATLPGRLLDAGELPGFDDEFRWDAAATTRREPRALAGTCHRYEMLSVGAMRVAHRDYLPADDAAQARANELVATFADAKTAWRAFEVLKSWQADCDKPLAKYDHHDIGAPQKVDIDAGEAHWYLLTYGPADGESEADYFDAEGLALVGNRIAVIRMTLVGQDYSYAAGKEPMVDAVRAAAANLR